jgi:hypothetical protein
MTASLGVTGLSSALKVATDTSPSDLQLVGEIGDISLGGESVEFAEFTHQQSTGGYREFKPTFKTGGDVTFSFNWTNDTQQGTLKSGYDASDLMYFEITYPNGKSHSFTAYVAQIGTTAPMNGPLRKAVTLRITGEIVEA